MTPDELVSLIRAGDAQTLLDAIQSVNDSERVTLAKEAASLIKPPSGALSWMNNSAQCCANLAVVGLGDWDQVKRLRRDLTHLWSNKINLYDWIPKYLERRRPNWIEQWASHQLAEEINPAWRSVRQLVRSGTCRRLSDDNYIIRMVDGFWSERLADKEWKLVDSLRADSALIEDEIWRLFEVEPPGTGVLLFTNDLEDHPMSWSKALKTLADSAEIDRDRLLTATLDALRRGRRAAGATWYFKFHEMLEPDLSERLARQGFYLDLLSNSVPAVVSFALESLGQLAKEQQLDAQAFLGAVPRVFEVAPKGPPIAAIKLLGQLVKERPEMGESAALVVCRTLTHASPDVQAAGLSWLESRKLGPNAAIAAELDRGATSIAASLRDRSARLMQSLRTAASAGASETTQAPTLVGQKNKSARPAKTQPIKKSSPSPSPSPSQSTAENTELAQEEEQLRGEISQLTKVQRAATGIDAALRVLQKGGRLDACSIEPLKMNHLLNENEIKPITTLEELIEEFLTRIEGPCDADHFERLMDGLSRFCAHRPADFQKQTAPLFKRAEKLSNGFHESLMSYLGLRGLSFYLVAAWRQPQSMVRIEIPATMRQCGFEFLVDRVRELICRIMSGQESPLIAAPTHRGGWLSAATFVNRLINCQQAGLEPGRLDMIQALLRLAPDDRKVALKAARKLKLHREVVLFALGGTEDVAAVDSTADPALWVAAIRGRDPAFAIAKRNKGIDGPDAWRPAIRRWQAVRRPKSQSGERDWPLWITMTVEPEFNTKDFPEDFPTLKLNYDRRLDEEWVASERRRFKRQFPKAVIRHSPLPIHWDEVVWGPGMATASLQIWPINPDPIFVTGITSILSTLDSPASNLRRTPEFLEPLFSLQTQFSDMAQLLVAVSLLAKDTGLKGTAIDALIMLIEDGRCSGEEMGDALRKLLISDAVKCNRLAEQLGEVARVSPLHASVCSRIVQTMFNDETSLPGGQLPGDAHHLLSHLLEWLIELKEPLGEATRSVLAKLTGTSKTAKLAKELLARTAATDSLDFDMDKQRQQVLMSIRGRLRRARLCQS